MIDWLCHILGKVLSVKCRSCGYFTLRLKDGLCIECQAELRVDK